MSKTHAELQQEIDALTTRIRDLYDSKDGYRASACFEEADECQEDIERLQHQRTELQQQLDALG